MAVAWRPLAYLFVPAVTLAVAVFLLLTVASPRTLIAARLWGGPSVATAPQSLRLECVRRSVGVEDRVPLEGLTVELDGEALPTACGPDGQAELSLAGRPGGSHAVRVRRGEEVLAEGQVGVTEQAWLAGAVTFPDEVPASGTLPVRASLVGGVLLAERWGSVLLSVPDEWRAADRLKVTASGAELGPLQPHPRGLRLSLRPTFFHVILSVQGLPAEGRPGASWEARIPVTPSGIDVEERTVTDRAIVGRLRSLTPVPAAYVRVQDRLGRRAAARIPLRPDGRGGAWAPLDLPIPPLAAPAWLITSSSSEVGAGSLPWPLDAEAEARDGRVVPDVRWLDGMAPAVTREASRMQQRLGAVGVVVLLGALLEALLLYDRARVSRLAFQRHLAETAEADVGSLEPPGAGLRVAIAIVVVLFGFAVVGSLLLGRIG